MFTKLETPDTQEYNDFKKLVLSANFSVGHIIVWQQDIVNSNDKGYSDLAFYSHSFSTCT